MAEKNLFVGEGSRNGLAGDLCLSVSHEVVVSLLTGLKSSQNLAGSGESASISLMWLMADHGWSLVLGAFPWGCIIM